MPPPPPYKAKAEVADQGYAAAANMPVTCAAALTPKKLKVTSKLKRASASQSVTSTASTSKSAQKSKYILVILSFNNRNLKLIDLTLL